MLNIILLLFSVIVNGYVLSWMLYILFLLYCLLAPHVDYTAYSNTFFYCAGYIICILLNALAINHASSKAIIRLIGAMFHCRNASQSESNKIDHIINEVLHDLRQKHLWNLHAMIPINILIGESMEEYSHILGANTIIVSFGLINNASTETLKAILTQEIARLHFKSGVMILGLVLSSLPIVLVMLLYHLYIKCINFVSKSLAHISKLLYFLAFIPLAFFSPIIVLNFASKWLLYLLLGASTKNYDIRADQVVVSLGLKSALYNYLNNNIHYRSNPQTDTKNYLITLLFESRASSMTRISRL